jgi:hypothetical protein
MSYKVPIEFEKGFMNEVCSIQKKEKRDYEFFNENEYQIISNAITDIFGYKIIPKKEWYQSILKGNDELRVYDKLGKRITTHYGNNWGEYILDGILAFDEYYKRFVVFQFREYFAHGDSGFHIIDGLSKLSEEGYKRATINFNQKYYGNEINYDLNKLIVIYKEIHYSQLIEYFERFNDYNKTIELWKYIKVNEDLSVIDKFILGYKEINWENKELKEDEFISIFNLPEKTMYNYEIFKEYLKFNFTDIEIDAGVDEHKFNDYVESYSEEDNCDDGEYYYSYFNTYYGKSMPSSPSAIPTEKISYLKKFIDSFINAYEIDYSKKLVIDFKDFLFFKIKVRTQGTSLNDETGLYHYDYDKDDFLNFKFSFFEKYIIVSMILNNQKLTNDPQDLILDDKTTFSEIKGFVNFFSSNKLD